MYFLKLNLKSLSYHFSSHLLAHSKNEKKSYFILPSHIQQSLSFVNSTSIYVPNLVFFVISITNYYRLSLLVELNYCLSSSHLCLFLFFAHQTRRYLKNSNLFMGLVGEIMMHTTPLICSQPASLS